MLEIARLFLFVFGLLTIAGGVMGFVKAKSKASLIAGGVSGALLLVAGALTPSKAGLALGLIVSLALAGRFGGAYAKTRKPMPAGLMAALGVVGVLVTIAALLH